MKNQIDNDKLRELCIANEWFTMGNNTQYDRLFKANDEGASIGDLATMIWMCSADFRRSDILEALRVETLPLIGIGCLVDALRGGRFGEWEIEQICLSVSQSSLNGTVYKTI